MSRPTTYLLRMILFLIIIAAVSGWLWRMLAHAFMANPALDGTIIAILLVGIIWNLHLVIRLYPEIRWAETMRQARSGLTAPPRTRLLGPLSSFVTQTEATEKAPLRLSAQRTETVLDSLNARMDESRDISRYMTQLLIFLGLLGTFYGLLLTIRSIADVIGGLPSADSDIAQMFDHVKNGLVQPLSGMATAFSGSMFGLAGALILGFLDLTAGQAQNRFFNELEDWLNSQAKTEPANISLTPAYGSEAFAATMESWLPRVQDFMSLTTENIALLQQNQAVLRSLVRDNQESQQQLIATLRDILSTLEQQGREQASTQLLQDIGRQIRSLHDDLRARQKMADQNSLNRP
ncbi:flagellar motor protein MotA [Acetobacteraceae bacterium ESL0709]|nr:flagellar motor protein MotA [Acetobacteraceae bacterium ESL0697]MDF7678525.1 flagellar motor protein MotA [Acetobacteraceae bacterium ESL0709]